MPGWQWFHEAEEGNQGRRAAQGEEAEEEEEEEHAAAQYTGLAIKSVAY